MTIYGGVHSNDDLLLTAPGGAGFVDGDITWVDSETISNVTASGGVYQWDVAAIGYPPTPGGWDIDDYRPTAGPVSPLTGGSNQLNADYHYFAGNTTLTGVQSGLNFVDGDLTLNGTTATSATYVATGEIQFIGANSLDSPFDDTGLGVFSDAPGVPDCTGPDTAIRWSGPTLGWAGVQYAPNGLVKMASAYSYAFGGSIIAYRVDLAGSNITITHDNSYTGVEVTSLRLEK